MIISVDGVPGLMAALKKMASASEPAAHAALEKIVSDLEGKAVELAPVKIGDLRRSSFSEVEGLEGTVGFTEVYATRQHEHVEYVHPKGGQAKYLSGPLEQSEGLYVAMIEKKIAEVAK